MTRSSEIEMALKSLSNRIAMLEAKDAVRQGKCDEVVHDMRPSTDRGFLEFKCSVCQLTGEGKWVPRFR